MMERIQEKAGRKGGRVEARARDTQGHVLKAGWLTLKLSKMTLAGVNKKPFAW